MIASCESCGEDFLTESDPHVVRPTKSGYKLYCYCHIKGFDEVKTNPRIEALVKENELYTDKIFEMEANASILIKALEKITKSNYEFNPWTTVLTEESKIASEALAKYRGET
jgi:hypothetical protein